jgi:type IV pilus assembly protein PilX
MNLNSASPTRGKRQQGVVLVVSLLMLLVLTLIGLAATRSTTLEERMTANQNDTAVAFQAAEAALRDGEGQLSGASQPNFAANAAGGYMVAGAPDWRTPSIWSDSSKVKMYGGGITPTPASAPSYYIVQTNYYTNTTGNNLNPNKALETKFIFYIYAHGYGVTSNTEVVLQSAYQE